MHGKIGLIVTLATVATLGGAALAPVAGQVCSPHEEAKR
jgi:hypothetical protein